MFAVASGIASSKDYPHHKSTHSPPKNQHVHAFHGHGPWHGRHMCGNAAVVFDYHAPTHSTPLNRMANKENAPPPPPENTSSKKSSSQSVSPRAHTHKKKENGGGKSVNAIHSFNLFKIGRVE